MCVEQRVCMFRMCGQIAIEGDLVCQQHLEMLKDIDARKHIDTKIDLKGEVLVFGVLEKVARLSAEAAKRNYHYLNVEIKNIGCTSDSLKLIHVLWKASGYIEAHQYCEKCTQYAGWIVGYPLGNLSYKCINCEHSWIVERNKKKLDEDIKELI